MRMKVLLKEDVGNLGYAGEVHDVADGYGRNYLIPQGLAVKATPNVVNQARIWRQRAEARREQLRSEHEALTARINDTVLTFTARAGETGKLYGSVTTTQVADELNETLGTDIDRRNVGTEPLRELGEHKVVVRLSGDFQPEVTVVVRREGVEETETAAVEEETEETAEVAEETETVSEAEDIAAAETTATEEETTEENDEA
jgi:large subunit ribosomal protein L9